MYNPQPELYQTIPITLTVTTYRGGVEAYNTTAGTETYVWTRQTTPAGDTMWIGLKSTSTPEKTEPVQYKAIPKDLYETIKVFYMGKPKSPVWRKLNDSNT